MSSSGAQIIDFPVLNADNQFGYGLEFRKLRREVLGRYFSRCVVARCSAGPEEH